MSAVAISARLTNEVGIASRNPVNALALDPTSNGTADLVGERGAVVLMEVPHG